jgi:hypothetical protein
MANFLSGTGLMRARFSKHGSTGIALQAACSVFVFSMRGSFQRLKESLKDSTGPSFSRAIPTSAPGAKRRSATGEVLRRHRDQRTTLLAFGELSA